MFTGQVDVSQVAYRPRESPFPMISVDEAVATVMEHAQTLSEKTVNFTGISVICRKLNSYFISINYKLKTARYHVSVSECFFP